MADVKPYPQRYEVIKHASIMDYRSFVVRIEMDDSRTVVHEIEDRYSPEGKALVDVVEFANLYLTYHKSIRL